MAKRTARTLNDIAQLAKVSTATVSRALNNSPLINHQTRERIQAIAREQEFRTNSAARNLSLRHSHTVAFVTPNSEPEFFSADGLFGLEILSGIGKGLSALGYDLLIVHVDQDDDAWVNSYFGSSRVDGFILLTEHRKLANIKKLLEVGVPFITWGMPIPNHSYCTVTGDNHAGGRLATRHLLQLGRKKIAFLGGPSADLSVRYRYDGYRSALADTGHSLDTGLVAFGGDYSHASGVVVMQRLLEHAPGLDAVFASSDLMAMGAIKTLHALGRRVPEDVAVIGYDDLSIAAVYNPPLTTIRQNVLLAGGLLAQNLVQYIRTGVITNVTTPVELVLRQSA